INYDLPNDPENYVHRIGRTARAGRDGIAISFCAKEEVSLLKSIEKFIKLSVPVDTTHPFHGVAPQVTKGPRPQNLGSRNSKRPGPGSGPSRNKKKTKKRPLRSHRSKTPRAVEA
ncbi:MAG: hypothetical protein KC493_11745, partial [Bacteriovoracaceae bacterium]|nr:hypothetical protein [Bacteriovoracaceae bacterium]